MLIDIFRFLILAAQLWEIEATSASVHRHTNYKTQTWQWAKFRAVRGFVWFVCVCWGGKTTIFFLRS